MCQCVFVCVWTYDDDVNVVLPLKILVVIVDGWIKNIVELCVWAA